MLMRARRDFQIPKIVREDEVIFFGLLGDLYPGIDPQRKRDESLESYVNQACKWIGDGDLDANWIESNSNSILVNQVIYSIKISKTWTSVFIQLCVTSVAGATQGARVT